MLWVFAVQFVLASTMHEAPGQPFVSVFYNFFTNSQNLQLSDDIFVYDDHMFENFSINQA